MADFSKPQIQVGNKNHLKIQRRDAPEYYPWGDISIKAKLLTPIVSINSLQSDIKTWVGGDQAKEDFMTSVENSYEVRFYCDNKEILVLSNQQNPQDSYNMVIEGGYPNIETLISDIDTRLMVSLPQDVKVLGPVTTVIDTVSTQSGYGDLFVRMSP